MLDPLLSQPVLPQENYIQPKCNYNNSNKPQTTLPKDSVMHPESLHHHFVRVNMEKLDSYFHYDVTKLASQY